MRTSILILALLGLCGCVHEAVTREPKTLSAVQCELDGFAALFQKVVALENREPSEHESLGSFLAAVPKKKLDDLGGVVRFDSHGQPVLADGSVITYSRSFGSCMLFEKGSVTSMDYIFTAAGHEEKAEVSINATFGEPFEKS